MEYQERVSYLEALMYVATLDEKVEADELEHFNQVGMMYGLENKEIEAIKKSIMKKEKTLEAILSPIESRKVKLSLIYELLGLCYADGTYNLAEKNGMINICMIMGIEAEKLSELEMAMEESLILQRRIYAILESEE